jgi:membrane protein YqaA with SNARE-associated domain
MHSLSTFLHQIVALIQPLAERLGGPGLALVAFLDSTFVPLPQVGDALIVLLTIQHPERWLYYSGATTLGSVAGCQVLYLIARKGGEALLRRQFNAGQIERGLGLFRRFGLLAVTVPAVLPPPTPLKLFVLLAGLAGVRPMSFAIAIAIGRAFRFGGEGWLAYRYGPQATQYIEENLATASLVVAGLVLVVGVAVILVRSRRARRRSA